MSRSKKPKPQQPTKGHERAEKLMHRSTKAAPPKPVKQPDMRLSFDLKPLKEVLDEMKAKGLYPVSMRLVRRKKPS